MPKILATESQFLPKVLNNAHKITFVMKHYPDKKLPDLLTLMAMPAVDINSALWAAEDLGYITQPNKKTGELAFKAEPKDGWDFGQSVKDLQGSLLYCMSVLARTQSDLEEFFISKWTAGYPVIDVLVAMKSLLVTNRVTEYELQDQRRDEKGHLMFEEDENTPLMDTYIFYTLPENAAHQWGKLSFKNRLEEEAKK